MGGANRSLLDSAAAIAERITLFYRFPLLKLPLSVATKRKNLVTSPYSLH